ncbi:MAG TPA: glycerol-3-phosphate dehydrogenase/oxidase [Zoogloea sp.]|uniref:glycerol-3-phosphate dehydrogenase/oxidase n=1 Tax=Zoogloea sp. TaxID=49181 RepID=UPI002D0D3329|nr:glycerol-3-phosphate dehydrogenase/oxidase [Zoogloea sp.]HMZ77695.1 glycerol-3-phosphate dehydrogenase/oxidase [Rhodocyclaceae bacterium]HNB66138.1 glycerol-3-phosphate dehydrogenase/oxidase [Rhodocyclaceae bacterium]HNF62584.1 glycerol-3-phosphate dehydrogenase/oxidase [Rhodocyclaceae bacterium]HNI46761.1 glycerol-3-phosphate dehydrogenase/oxidase [Zoogloea sp.]
MKRADRLIRLRHTARWDILIVGGGATGLGCAVDAAARGHSTLLLEAGDFAGGTSSRSTKLIHGGVRYLAQGRLGLVREALAERTRLLRNAPHLVHPQGFVVPVHGAWEGLRLGLGLRLYDHLAGADGLGPCRSLSADATLAALPGLRPDGLRGGLRYQDARFDDARLAITLMRSAEALGALTLNALRVTGLLHAGGRVAGVAAEDGETGEHFELPARVVINATGVWSDAVRRLDDPDAPPQLAPSQGAHVVVDRDFLPGDDALLIPRTDDGRVLFVIPWQGRLLLGTTDTPRTDLPAEPRPLDAEIDFILTTAARYLTRAPRRDDVRSAFAGLRPLIGGTGASARLSREHLIQVSTRGLVSVAGGKWTTYRSMAEAVVDRAEAVGGLPPRPCPTPTLRLFGAPTAPTGDVYGCERAAIERLPGAGRRLHPAFTLSEAEVRHAARAEQARSVADVLARRHRALFIDAAAAQQAAPAVAAVMASELGWDAPRTHEMTEAFHRLAEGFR